MVRGIGLLLLATLAATTADGGVGFSSVDTGYTICKVRTAANLGASYIVASSASTATVHFHTVKPVKMVDLLSGESLDTSNRSSATVDVACGLFRFLDIELDSPLQGSPKP